ncbi:DNA damage response protein RcaA [Histoplasma ohiense]|nr:DNA damage response protein RcaA [Histoplasma ohiense (nom. inval.)]
MWILSSDGDFLRGKRVWLKPGKQYLFGRVKKNGVHHAIDNVTISRQHLVIEVGQVKPGDGLHVHAKSRLKVTDQKTKCGTIIDGEPIKGVSKELNKDEHVIQIGKYPHPLRIKWHPVVLSFSLPSKTNDPLSQARASLEELDIKTVVPYVVGKTTHVVQNKRNTSKGLQALINGRHIVQKSYIEAIVYAAAPGDLESEEALCPLEEDFDAFWPDPTQYLPLRGKEPTRRSDAAYQPDPSRVNVFEGYTFIFCDGSRFDDLQGPITNGHGKALLYEIERGRTTAEDIVNYMKQVAGNKGLRNFDGSGGVILVKFRKADDHCDWDIEIENRVASLTGQKIVETSEFLDAILGNDASSLIRSYRMNIFASESQVLGERVPMEDDEPRRMGLHNTKATSHSSNRSRSRTYVSKFKTFDDGFDMDSIPMYTLEHGSGSEETSQARIPDSLLAQSQTSIHLSEGEDIVSELLPGAAAMKIRLAKGRKRAKSTPPPEASQKPKRARLNVMEAARQRRLAVDEEAMQQREQEVAPFCVMTEGVEIGQFRNLAIVEEMVMPAMSREQIDPTHSVRYDERWSGRNNFKKFRRKGHGCPIPHTVQPVIVPLEEVKRRDSGLGETCWRTRQPKSACQTSNDRTKETPSTSHPIVLRNRSLTPPSRIGKRSRDTRVSGGSDTEDGLRFRFRIRKGK